MKRNFIRLALAAGAAAALAGCATKEQIEANAERRMGAPQTGTNIVKRDQAGRVTGTSDADNNQRALDDLRNVPNQTAVPRGGGG
jgi:hypothetical protein